VIEIRKRVQGIDHQDMLNSVADLASTYIDQHSARHGGRRLLRDLTGRIRDDVQVTEYEMEQVTRYFDKRLITLLLKLRKDKIPVTGKVVKAAAENREYSEEVLGVLLDQRSDEVKITERVDLKW
jgi:hypothetical protein